MLVSKFRSSLITDFLDLLSSRRLHFFDFCVVWWLAIGIPIPKPILILTQLEKRVVTAAGLNHRMVSAGPDD
jgi:hypothetical protein